MESTLYFSAKILLCGQTRVGKTSLFRAFSGDDWSSEYTPTLKSNLLVAEAGGCSMQLWDLGFRPGRAFFKGSSAMLLVVDSCDLNEEALDSAYDQAKALVGFADDLFPCFLLATKMDLLGDGRDGRERGRVRLQAWARQRRPHGSTPLHVYCTSALEQTALSFPEDDGEPVVTLTFTELLGRVALIASGGPRSAILSGPMPQSNGSLAPAASASASTSSSSSIFSSPVANQAAGGSSSSSSNPALGQAPGIRPIKVVVCGARAVGKTSLVSAFVNHSLDLGNGPSPSLSHSSPSHDLSQYSPTAAADLRVATVHVDVAMPNKARAMVLAMQAAATASASGGSGAAANQGDPRQSLPSSASRGLHSTSTSPLGAPLPATPSASTPFATASVLLSTPQPQPLPQPQLAATLHIWDTAGDHEIVPLGRGIIKGADCLLLVYDISSHDSFLALDSFYANFVALASASSLHQQHGPVGGHPTSGRQGGLPNHNPHAPSRHHHSNGYHPSDHDYLNSFPCVLIGNKCDQCARRDVALEDVLAWCVARRPKRPISYMECSVALNNLATIRDAFLCLAEEAMKDLLLCELELSDEEDGEGGGGESGDGESGDDSYDDGSDEGEGSSGEDAGGGREGETGHPQADPTSSRARARVHAAHTPGRSAGSQEQRGGGRGNGVRLTPSSADTCGVICLWGSGS